MVARSPTAPARALSRRQFVHRVALILGGLGCAPLLGACGGSAAEERGDEPIIEMTDDLRFVPDRLTIRAGQSVVWRNAGEMVHTVTGDPAKAQDPAHATLPTGATAWDSGLIRQDETWRHTFDSPGTYTYFCIPHESANMVASVVVEG